MNTTAKASVASVDVSLCIVNWNTADLVIKLLDSAYTLIKDVTFETIVVDNASSDGSVERVACEYPQTALVKNDVNVGYSAAMNQALHLARGRYMLILNADVVLLPSAVEQMVGFLDQHPEVGAVGSVCLDANERLGWSYGMFPRPGKFFLDWVFGRWLPRKFRPPALAHVPSATVIFPFEVEYIIGACMLVRREIVDHVGFLDERFFAFFEETDWCLRMRQQGWRIYLLPEARAIHFGSASFDQVPAEKMRRWYESFYLYIEKHYGSFVVYALKLAAVWKKYREKMQDFVRRIVTRRIYQSFPQPIRYFVRWIAHLSIGNYLWPHQRKRILEELRQRLSAEGELSFWFLPTQTWFSTIFQRPQQMARALAEIGCTVVYCEPWVADWVASSEAAQGRQFVGVKDIAPRLHLLRCPFWMVQGFIRDASPDVLIMIWPDQTQFIPKDISCAVVYEMIDSSDLVTHADERWHKLHREWVQRADVMVATADDLIEQLRNERPDALLLPNAVRLEDWALSGMPPVPEDMRAARRAPVVVGYYGAIAEWFDWDFWEYAARHKPDWTFVLIGPPYDGDVNKIKERVAHFENMHYLGAKPYSALPGYLVHFDVATIPFVLNNITHACSPLKLFEYMAAGKPIVVTPMREIIKYKSVLVADSPQAFVSQCERALTLRDDEAYRAILQQEAEANTWRARARALRQAIESTPKRQVGQVC